MTIWNNIKTIVILFESDRQEGNTDIQYIIRQLRSMGKDVYAWGYVPKYEILSAANTTFRILGTEDITICGKIQKALLREWKTISADLLLDLTLREHKPLLHLATTAQTTYKAGKTRNEPYAHDFMIQLSPDQTRQDLYEQIVHYLQLLEQKD